MKFLFRTIILGIICLNTTFANNVEEQTKSIIIYQTDDFRTDKLNQDVEAFKSWEKEQNEKAIKEEKTGKTVNDEHCFLINNIVIEGNTALSAREIGQFIKPKLGVRLCASEITTYANELSKIYIQKGFITTTVFIKPQNLRLGNLVITVIEGKVESVKFGRNTIKDRVTKFMISPLKEGENLNIKKLDQITDNLQNIPSYRYKTELNAGSVMGASALEIKGERGFPLSASVTFDDFGQETTGKNRYNFSLTEENLIGLAENINASYMFADDAKRKESYSKSLSLGVGVPFRFSKLQFNTSHSKFLTVIEGKTQSFISSGSTLSQSLMLQHVVFRNTRSKLTFIFGLNAYDSSNYINDVKSNVQSRKLTNAEAGLMLNFYTSYGAFFAKASYVKGLTLLDGLKDKPDIARSAPHAQFDMFKFFLLYNNKLRVVPLSFSSAFEGQYTNVEVYSQNQMTLSGSNGIRGFKDANVFGIRGISVKNDLDFRLFDVTQINYIKYLGFGVFLDGGITGSVNTGSNAGSASRKTNKIAGTGAKFTINHNNVDLNLTLAYPIYYSKHLAKEINKKPVVYIRGGLRI